MIYKKSNPEKFIKIPTPMQNIVRGGSGEDEYIASDILYYDNEYSYNIGGVELNGDIFFGEYDSVSQYIYKFSPRTKSITTKVIDKIYKLTNDSDYIYLLGINTTSLHILKINPDLTIHTKKYLSFNSNVSSADITIMGDYIYIACVISSGYGYLIKLPKDLSIISSFKRVYKSDLGNCSIVNDGSYIYFSMNSRSGKLDSSMNITNVVNSYGINNLAYNDGKLFCSHSNSICLLNTDLTINQSKQISSTDITGVYSVGSLLLLKTNKKAYICDTSFGNIKQLTWEKFNSTQTSQTCFGFGNYFQLYFANWGSTKSVGESFFIPNDVNYNIESKYGNNTLNFTDSSFSSATVTNSSSSFDSIDTTNSPTLNNSNFAFSSNSKSIGLIGYIKS